MTRREQVKKAIRFGNPDYIPIWFHNRDHKFGDVMRWKFSIVEDNVSEWGYQWVQLDDSTMGQPGEPVLSSWDNLENFAYPTLNREKRAEGIEEFIADSGDRYLLAGEGISGFNTYTFLRGFENAMIDFAVENPQAMELLDAIMRLETEVITLAAELGFDGVHFSDDWGTQDGLIISPDMWHKIFRPRYKKQFDHAHSLGLDIWFHSCGDIADIVGGFHEIGVDVMNISQPNVVDIAKIGAEFKGKQTFMMPISYQTVSISGTPQQIKAEAARLYDMLGTERGGFIGYVEDYSCMGMSEENFQACIQGFRELR